MGLIVNSCRALIMAFLCKWRARVGLGAHKAPGRHATRKPPDREGGLFFNFLCHSRAWHAHASCGTASHIHASRMNRSNITYTHISHPPYRSSHRHLKVKLFGVFVPTASGAGAGFHVRAKVDSRRLLQASLMELSRSAVTALLPAPA